ncbi:MULTISPECIES: universal stress protein [unclassified Coleofasciculus]|uniref:universal stress protein n=1 Tax=unclassified Coleofasciculus TaxID=2692782 RepID=UPI00187E80F8|nr:MULTISPECIES: universal stress protein [unclassified Coleofasciculus]MBE9128886.1 universal stress protein [Coleofasciculus sp. LEGE 07081]MBE9151607.1 universal stress protein [Coleofasciculus sp. LEGE 07092]
MVFQKILVALDLSPQSPKVFEQALEIAQNEHSQLMLFHCLSWDVEGEAGLFMGTVGGADLYGSLLGQRQKHLQDEVKTVREWLQTYQQQATSMGIATEFDCRIGDLGPQICALAHTWQTDLIVIGRRGYKGLSEIWLGSVSNYVIHHAPCSVLIVQGVTPPVEQVESQSKRI